MIEYYEFHKVFMGYQFYLRASLLELDKWEVYELFYLNKTTWLDLISNRGSIRRRDKGGWADGKRVSYIYK